MGLVANKFKSFLIEGLENLLSGLTHHGHSIRRNILRHRGLRLRDRDCIRPDGSGRRCKHCSIHCCRINNNEDARQAALRFISALCW